MQSDAIQEAAAGFPVKAERSPSRECVTLVYDTAVQRGQCLLLSKGQYNLLLMQDVDLECSGLGLV